MKKLIFLASILSLLACSPESPKQVAEASFPQSAVKENNNKVAFNPKVDILFVIDNSGSMSTAQANLIANIDKFTASISKLKILNYHIGVLTSDMMAFNQSGRLQGNPYFVTAATPNVANVLAQTMKVGTNGSGYEMFYDPVIEALSSPLVNNENKNFYRDSASLAIIFITDAPEQSQATTDQVYNFLVNLKKGDAQKVLAYGVIKATWNLNLCPSDGGEDDPTTKIEDFLNRVSNSDGNHNNILSLCSPNYGDKLAEFAQDIAKRSTGILYLNRIPLVGTIHVAYGTQEILNHPTEGWTYDPSNNSLRFGDKIQWSDQGPNTEVAVTFESGDW